MLKLCWAANGCFEPVIVVGTILSTMVFTISFCNSLLKQFKTVCFPGLGAGSTRPALRWRGPGRGRGEPGVHSGLSQRCWRAGAAAGGAGGHGPWSCRGRTSQGEGWAGTGTTREQACLYTLLVGEVTGESGRRWKWKLSFNLYLKLKISPSENLRI